MMHRTVLTSLLAGSLLWPAAPQAQASPTSPATPASHGAATGQATAKGLGNIRLSNVRLEEVAQLLSQAANANVVVTSKVADETVSLYLSNASVEDMVRNTCRAAGVWYRYDSPSGTYIIMSRDEYQKDIAIVQDEKTQVYTLRHQNVVATAHAIKGLFGGRVSLSMPVEEKLPSSLGSGARTRTGGSSNDTRGTTGASRGSVGMAGAGGNARQSEATLPGSGFNNIGSPTMSTGSGTGNNANQRYDPSQDLNAVSQDRLLEGTALNAQGQAVLSTSSLQSLAARQGPPILVTYNLLNNLLLVRTGDEHALAEISRLIADMDKPPKQVLLEMKILEVTLDDGYRSVFDIGMGSKKTTAGPNGWGATNSPGVDALYSLGSGRFDVENDATAIWQMMSRSFSLRLQLLAQENKLKVLSSPMLVAANNQLARLFIGDERILTVGASSQSTTGTTGATNTNITVETEKRDVGQTLAILPRINDDGSVSLTVDQDSSTVKIGDTTIPISTSDGSVRYFPIDTVSTASLQVTAHARDGMTIVIGGMIKESEVRDRQQVPLLGDVPAVGFLFKRDVRARERTQIVLLITPRIISSPQEGQAIAQAKSQEYQETTAVFPQTPIVPKLDFPGTAATPASEAPGNSFVLDGQ